MRRIENSTIPMFILSAALIWFWGWFIFVVIETVMRLLRGSPWGGLPWPPMILFTLFLYGSAGIAVGGIVGGLTGLLPKAVKRWQQGIEALPLIMSCCLTILVLLYTSLFIHERLPPLYPNLSPVFINLLLIILSIFLLSALYMLLVRIVDKTRLIASYLALSITLYTFMMGGLYINEQLLSGSFFNLDTIRVTANIGIFLSSVILYVITYIVFIFLGNRAYNKLKSRRFNTLIVIALLLLALGGAALYSKIHPSFKQPVVKKGGQAEDRPNIILITMDTTRADHLSCYGYHKNTSPHLDKIASESVVFKNAYAPSPWTLPSHASIFTGMYPARHGAHNDWEKMKSNWPRKLSTQHKTLAEILAAHGYRTAGVIGSRVCHSFFGLAQGFEYYDDTLISVLPALKYFTLFKILSRWIPLDDIAARQGLNGCRIAPQINKIVFSWLEKHYQSPFFLFINYFDPHIPYIPPDQYFQIFREGENAETIESKKYKRDLLAQYDGEIAYLDYHMAKLFERLKELNIYDTTMIIITSDHGEYFGEHDFWIHGHELYEEVLKIPLIIKYPSSHPKKGVSLNRVSLVDIMPTILNFLKLPLPKDLQGINLFEGTSRVMAEIYLHKYTTLIDLFVDRYVKDKRFRKENRFARELKALFLDNYKYIKEHTEESKGQEELYDIGNDPQESLNLIDTMPEKAKEMEMKLMEWLPHGESRKDVDETVKLDKATEEALRVLGYIQ
jgi:arylsulfatase A-like enzyme